MLLIECPHCGPRDEVEFSCGGEAHIARPTAPDSISDAEWADYLYMRNNPKGALAERWCHILGCRRWFNVERDTVTQEFLRVYPMGEPRGGGSGA
jgi:heterotetrameric sarcosine oxidase delta subunit